MTYRETDLPVPCPPHPQPSFLCTQQGHSRQALLALWNHLQMALGSPCPSPLSLVVVGAIVMMDRSASWQPRTESWELGATVTLQHRENSMTVVGWNETLERKHCVECGSQATISQSCLHFPHNLSWPLGIHSTLQVVHIAPVVAWMPWEASQKAAGKWASVLRGIYEGSLSRLDGPEGNSAGKKCLPKPWCPTCDGDTVRLL